MELGSVTGMVRSLPILLALAAPVAAQSPPPDPALSPPAPALLTTVPAGRPAAAATAPAPLAGLEAMPNGAWRLRFPPGRDQPDATTTTALGELGRRLTMPPTGRVTVLAQASGPVIDASAARRLTLARAEAVKQALAAGGLDPTRIDLRPLGRTAEALDVADILPPPPTPG